MIRSLCSRRLCIRTAPLLRASGAIVLSIVAGIGLCATPAAAREPVSTKPTPASTISVAAKPKLTSANATLRADLNNIAASADYCPACARPLDQVWVISTRGFCCPNTIDSPPNLPVQRCLPDGSWVSASLPEFLATDDPALPTSFVIHGNRVDSSLAVSQGMRAYRRLTIGLPVNQPVRFVIWSWPSQRSGGILKDVRLKAARTTTDCKYLAWTLRQLNPQTPVSLIGFSFGARIATGALHVVAGGSLNGFSLGPESTPRMPARVVLVAAALRNDWLLEGCYHGKALEAVESMLLINNSCDMALKRYHFVDVYRDAEALGYTGPAGWSPHYVKIRQFDACCDLGKSHDWELYIASSRYAALMRQYAWPTAAAPFALQPGREEVVSAPGNP